MQLTFRSRLASVITQDCVREFQIYNCKFVISKKTRLRPTAEIAKYTEESNSGGKETDIILRVKTSGIPQGAKDLDVS